LGGAVGLAGCVPAFGGAGVVAAFAGAPTVCVSEIEGVAVAAGVAAAAVGAVSGPNTPNAAGHVIVAVVAAGGVAAAGVVAAGVACGTAIPPGRDRRQSCVATQMVLVLSITSNSSKVRLGIGGCLLAT
jgi:hypothetical protein